MKHELVKVAVAETEVAPHPGAWIETRGRWG